jgi:transposase
METTTKVSEMEQEIKALKEIVASQISEISELKVLIKFYEEQFKLAQRRQFGSSSEQSSEQLYLFENMFNEAEDQANPLLPEPAYEEITYKRKKRKGKREEDLSGLPVERIDHELSEDKRGCPECGELMHDIGVDVRRELKLIPAKVVVVEHAAHAYACPNADCLNENGNNVIVKADTPAPLIAGSLASPSIVSYIAMQKYLSGMLLYRIEKGFQYDGVVISRQTMSNWVIKCVEMYLVAIYALLKSYLLKESVIHADETTHQVLHEPGRAPQTKSYEWLYRTSGK